MPNQVSVIRPDRSTTVTTIVRTKRQAYDQTDLFCTATGECSYRELFVSALKMTLRKMRLRKPPRAGSRCSIPCWIPPGPPSW